MRIFSACEVERLLKSLATLEARVNGLLLGFAVLSAAIGVVVGRVVVFGKARPA